MLMADLIQLNASFSPINSSGKVSAPEFYKMKVFFMFIADMPEIILKTAWCKRLDVL